MNGNEGLLRTYLRRVLFQRFDPVVARLEARLPSVVPEAQFQAVIDATWLPGTRVDQSMRSLAKQLLKVARSIASEYSVLDRDEARYAIEQAFLADATVRSTGVAGLTLTDLRVPPEARSLAEKHEALRRDTALIQEERVHETERLRVLLTDPATARLWWLEGKPGKLQDLVDPRMDEMFAKVAALFGASAGSPVATDPIAELIRLFLQGLDAQFRERLIGQLRAVFSAYERDDLAARLSAVQHPHAPSPSPRDGTPVGDNRT